MAQQPYARAFNLHLPDGTTHHGTEFPGGVCITFAPQIGLTRAATTLTYLLEDYPDTTVTWADGAAG